MSYVWSDASSTSILHVCEQRRLWRDCADAQARLSRRLCDKYHNLMSWLKCIVHLSLYLSFNLTQVQRTVKKMSFGLANGVILCLNFRYPWNQLARVIQGLRGRRVQSPIGLLFCLFCMPYLLYLNDTYINVQCATFVLIM